MPFKTKCPGCEKLLQVPDTVVGKRVQCPACSHVWNVPPPTAAAESAASASNPAPAPRGAAGGAAPAPTAAQGPSFETACPGCGKTLQAQEAMVGKRVRCPACSHIWQISRPVVEAEPMLPEMPSNNWFDELAGDTYPVAGEKRPTAAADEDPSRRPCPMCGEMIVATAAKCRFCDAIFDEGLKRVEKKKKKRRGASDSDSSLSTLDWILCLIPLNIACIVGVIYMIKGKPKGIKMIGIAIAFQFIEGFLYGMIQAMSQAPR